LRTPAGARFTVRRRAGYSKPALRSAARMRSVASRTAPSGRPTVVVCGRPVEMSTSTSTTSASMPRSAPERTRASITSACRGRSLGAIAAGGISGSSTKGGRGCPRRPGAHGRRGGSAPRWGPMSRHAPAAHQGDRPVEGAGRETFPRGERYRAASEARSCRRSAVSGACAAERDARGDTAAPVEARGSARGAVHAYGHVVGVERQRPDASLRRPTVSPVTVGAPPRLLPSGPGRSLTA